LRRGHRPAWRRGGGRRFVLTAAFLLALGAVLPSRAAAAAARGRAVHTVALSADMRVAVLPGDEVYLEVLPRRGESLPGFSRRVCGDSKAGRSILSANPALAGRLLAGVRVRVPFVLVSASLRKAALAALFPNDRADASGWIHVVTAPSGRPESLWRIAQWYAGDGRAYKAIRAEGGLATLTTEIGQKVFVPARVLLPVFSEESARLARAGNARSAARRGRPSEGTVSAVSSAGVDEEGGPIPLEYGSDAGGRFALYRLQKGEALYSAVVVRFTGRVHAEDVNAKAAEIARANGISDVRSIPVGFAIRIPVEDLAAEFRPKDDPERIAEEASRLEAARFINRVRADDLSGVTLVLDAGHGGRDTGAIVHGLEEARYTHDLACRVQRLVETRTQGKVFPTIGGDVPCSRRPGEELEELRGARVLTTPPYALEDAVAGVHLRWYLANAILRGTVARGGSPDRTVFLSLHADSLHPAVRGAMIYIPGEKYLKKTYSKTDEVYLARREVREAPSVSFTHRERLKAEGVSRELAEKIVAAFRADDLPLHAYEPIRKNVIRAGREWVPAILRYNRIPARVLLEVCNLNNPEDRRLLTTPAYRDRVARAIVAALVEFYGGSARAVTADVASASAKPAASDAR
jgi:N-acetylmuramoyl-L-alanine amidase